MRIFQICKCFKNKRFFCQRIFFIFLQKIRLHLRGAGVDFKSLLVLTVDLLIGGGLNTKFSDIRDTSRPIIFRTNNKRNRQKIYRMKSDPPARDIDSDLDPGKNQDGTTQ